MLSSTFFTLYLAVSAFASPHSQFSKRHQSIVHQSAANATIVQRDLTGASNAPLTYFPTGLGACGQYNNDNQFIVALNSQDFGAGTYCHKTIVIEYNGIQLRATIMDECPGCKAHGPHGLDLSPGLFQRFAAEGAGVLYATWWFDGGYDAAGNGPSQNIGSGDSTTSSTYKPTSTYVPPPPPSTSTTAYSEAPITTSTWETSTSTTVESTSTSTSKTSTASTSSTTSSAPTPSVPASSPSDGETIESVFKAFIYMSAMIAFSSD